MTFDKRRHRETMGDVRDLRKTAGVKPKSNVVQTPLTMNLLISNNIIYPSQSLNRRRKSERRNCQEHHVPQFIRFDAFGDGPTSMGMYSPFGRTANCKRELD
jgi:hypothetical protein